jgi:hypothetical protein
VTGLQDAELEYRDSSPGRERYVLSSKKFRSAAGPIQTPINSVTYFVKAKWPGVHDSFPSNANIKDVHSPHIVMLLYVSN